MFAKRPPLERHVFGIHALLFLELFGAIFIAAGFLFANINRIDPSWVRTQGEVIDLIPGPYSSGGTNNSRRQTYFPVFRYVVEGKNYEFRTDWSSSNYPSLGSKGNIAYDPNSPNHAKVVESTGGWIALSLFPLVGSILVIMAPILFMRSLKRSRIINNLIQTGIKVSGLIVRVKSVGGPNRRRHHYKITVLATNNYTNIDQEYTSDPVSSYAELAVIDFKKNHIPVDVYINPTNSQEYYVNVAGIPDLFQLSKDAFSELNKKQTG